MTHALEALQQLLKTPGDTLQQILLSPSGIRASKIHASTNEPGLEEVKATPGENNEISVSESEQVLESDASSAFNASVLARGTVEIKPDESETGSGMGSPSQFSAKFVLLLEVVPSHCLFS